MRVIGYLNAITGAVKSEDVSRVSASRLARSVSELSETYPRLDTIYVVWDNWPVHKHHKVLAALEKQPRVEVLLLPTYSPWLNPIEKCWRWVKQRVTHAHPWSDDFSEFKQQVREELDALSQGSKELLIYAGLSH